MMGREDRQMQMLFIDMNTSVDELFDALLEIGIRPFVEFGFMPVDMASGEKTQFWWKGNVTPPTDWKKWEMLIDKTVRHFIDRYGIDEVRRWYFEVWNEPNLHNAFWTGGKSGYFEMYKVSAKCIKAIENHSGSADLLRVIMCRMIVLTVNLTIKQSI